MSNDPLTEGIEAARNGDRSKARSLLIEAAKQMPDSAQAWYWLSTVTEDGRKKTLYQQRAAELDPTILLRNGMDRPVSDSASRPTPTQRRPAQVPNIPKNPGQTAKPTPAQTDKPDSLPLPASSSPSSPFATTSQTSLAYQSRNQEPLPFPGMDLPPSTTPPANPQTPPFTTNNQPVNKPPTTNQPAFIDQAPRSAPPPEPENNQGKEPGKAKAPASKAKKTNKKAGKPAKTDKKKIWLFIIIGSLAVILCLCIASAVIILSSGNYGIELPTLPFSLPGGAFGVPNLIAGTITAKFAPDPFWNEQIIFHNLT